MTTSQIPLSLDQISDRLERLLLRHEELQKTNALLQTQLLEVQQERDSLKSRLAAARARVNALLQRLPAESTTVPSSTPLAWGSPDQLPASDE